MFIVAGTPYSGLVKNLHDIVSCNEKIVIHMFKNNPFHDFAYTA